MVNINGKEWMDLTPADIQYAISEIDFDESFYFELKDDRVSPKKMMEEVSAFSNTFGGYIFLGISDDKQIEGCAEWKPCVMQLYPKPIIWRIVDFARNNTKRDGKRGKTK